MAAEYEVNIKLNTQQVERQLKNIDTRTKRTGRMATENINALVKGQDKRARLMNKINELEAKGLNVAKLRKQMGQATTELAKRRFGSLQQEFHLLERSIRLEESKLRIMRSQAVVAQDRAKFLAGAQVPGLKKGQTLGPASPPVQGPRQMIASPIGGATNIKGSPAFLARQRQIKMLEQVGLGAGFPLLFGGGPGSVLGGAAGGLTGSFGAQIAFSAIGQQVDQFVASAVKAGQAFNSTGGALDFMREKSLFSTAAIEERAAVLEELGDVEELSTLLTQELVSKIGNEGVRSLQELGKTTDETTRLWSELTTQLFALISGPLNGFLQIVNQVLGGVTTSGRFAALSKSMAGNEEFEAAVKARKGTSRAGALSQAEKLELLELFGPKVPVTAQIPVTAADRRKFAVKDTAGEKAAREEARIQKRLEKLEEERQKIIEISRFKEKIAAAELARDEQLVIRLEGEQKIAEIEAKRKEDLVGITDQRLKDAINIEAATEKLAAHRETERELADLQRQKNQQQLDDMKKFIEQQYELNEAVKQQAALAEGIAQTMGQGMAQSFDLLINGAKNWGAALRDIAANVLQDIARQLIQIYVIEQAVGFLSAYLTPFAPGTPLGAGGGQVGRFGTLGPNYGIPQFANGGTPPVGKPSIVGEKGPELFVPKTAGTIVPNHAMGGSNIVVNVDASGSSVEGDAQEQKALGAAIGAAVQAELIKQKRPGGLLF